MPSEPALKPKEQGQLSFRSITIQTAVLADDFGYVSLNALCDAFGLNRQAQRRRLAAGSDYFDVHTRRITLDTEGGAQATLCLRADAVPLFLTGIQANRIVDDEARDLLLTFLGEAHTVLAEHFGLSERGEIEMHRAALARIMARQQALEDLIEAKLDLAQEGFSAAMENRADAIEVELRETGDEKLEQVRSAFSGLRSRIRTLESIAGPKERLTPEQLGQLKQTVNTLGVLKIELDGSTRPFPGIYADVFSMVGVSRSEHIPQGMFQEVLAFLDGQIAALRRRMAESADPE
jgi:hypothetical protein